MVPHVLLGLAGLDVTSVIFLDHNNRFCSRSTPSDMSPRLAELLVKDVSDNPEEQGGIDDVKGKEENLGENGMTIQIYRKDGQDGQMEDGDGSTQEED